MISFNSELCRHCLYVHDRCIGHAKNLPDSTSRYKCSFTCCLCCNGVDNFNSNARSCKFFDPYSIVQCAAWFFKLKLCLLKLYNSLTFWIIFSVCFIVLVFMMSAEFYFKSEWKLGTVLQLITKILCTFPVGLLFLKTSQFFKEFEWNGSVLEGFHFSNHLIL